MKKLKLSFLSLLVTALGFAQDAKVDVNVGKSGGGGFWTAPWFWIIIALVFILLLVALARGRSND
jgi:hypothetical protein